ncbi:MAG: DUF4359 domain-containing protein [Cyanobacteriota bacterium]|nr:DUF4359 domain-containing protein [Cyanobacteriota bacterium]
MKKSKSILPLVGLVGVGAALALTNPNQSDYEKYAAKQLNLHFNDSVCQEASFLQDQCTSLLKTGNAGVQKLVAETTQRKNFGVFSIYETEISTSLPLVPSYRMQTFGVFKTFHTYNSETR